MLLAVDSLPLSLLLLQQQATTASVLGIYSIDLSNLFFLFIFDPSAWGNTAASR